MSDLVERLLAAITEAEKRARDAQDGPWHIGNAVDPTKPCNVHTFPGARRVADEVPWLDAEHIVLHAPDRVLRLCQAHREIIDDFNAIANDPAVKTDAALYLQGKVLLHVLRKLAGGYGIQAEEEKSDG